MESIEISISFESTEEFKKGMKELHSRIRQLSSLKTEVENNIENLKDTQHTALINFCEEHPEYIKMSTSIPKHLTSGAEL